MIDAIKLKLLEDPTNIKKVLEHYGYCNIVIRSTYITCGRSIDSSPKSIVIRLKNNDALLVHDYARNMIADIFNFIIKQRKVTFREVISYCKKTVGIDYYCCNNKSRQAFGGFYSKIKSRNNEIQKVYDDSILNKYNRISNKRFLNDGISLETQKKYNIGYSVEDQGITIPIYDEIGNLIGVKCRTNKDIEDGSLIQKYYYLTNECRMSNTLYGYSHNYQYLERAENIFIFESEKSVLQADGFGVKECLALGSSSISKKQAKMILSLNAKNIYLMFDEGLDHKSIIRNIKTLQAYGRLKELNIYVWVPGNKTPLKSSPTDNGAYFFKNAARRECIREKDYLKLYDKEE